MPPDQSQGGAGRGKVQSLHQIVDKLEALQIARAACQVALRSDRCALPRRVQTSIVRLNLMIQERVQRKAAGVPGVEGSDA
jgi:hypothetical protein